jgi:hypothetical protein
LLRTFEGKVSATLFDLYLLKVDGRGGRDRGRGGDWGGGRFEEQWGGGHGWWNQGFPPSPFPPPPFHPPYGFYPNPHFPHLGPPLGQ